MSKSEFYTWENHDADLQLAKCLQEQFNQETNVEKPLGSIVYDQKKKKVDSSKSLVDPSWELVDPTPDIYNLFIVFNDQFFWGKLGAVSVKWSKRMTSCAGICSYNYRGGLCAIALSEPLLKLRPRKDLVETLLHEMIHALLFVTHNNKDRDGHGPEFHKHMYRINGEAGTNITVYHTFHDEVRLYQQHWWKCDGPCQHRKPFHGLVKRATNRAPGPNDFWWGEHSRSCGGTFIKIKEPEKPEKKKKLSKENKKPIEAPKKSNNDIRNFISSTSTPGPSKKSTGNTPIITVNDFDSSKSTKTKSNNPVNKVNNKTTGNTPIITINDLDSKRSQTGNNQVNKKTSGSYNGKNNINGFHNINTSPKKNCNSDNTVAPVEVKTIEVFSGSGNRLTSSPVIPKSYDAVREAWLKKLNTSLKEKNKRPLLNKTVSPAKKFRAEDEVLKENKILVKCPACNITIEDKKLNAHLDACLESNEREEEQAECPVCNASVAISELERHTNACLDNCVSDNGTLNKSVTEKKKCDICGINQSVENFDQHLANCLIIFCGEIQDVATGSNTTMKKNEESIYLESDEEDSFINDNSLMEDYNKSIKKEKSEVYFDSDDEEEFLHDNSLMDDYNKSLNDSSNGCITLDD